MRAAIPQIRTPVETRSRLDSVDLLRGLVMVIMALDHSRGFFSNATFYPLDLERTNVSLWLYGTPPGPNSPPISVPADRGFDLPVVYLVWILVVLLLYPVCKWFDGLKRRRREAWLSYL